MMSMGGSVMVLSMGAEATGEASAGGFEASGRVVSHDSKYASTGTSKRRISLLLLLLSVVGDGALDGVLSQDAAVDLDGWQVQLLDDGRVLELSSLVQGLALDPLGGQAGSGDGAAAAEGLELGVSDDTLVVDPDLEAHDVSTRGRADQARPD